MTTTTTPTDQFTTLATLCRQNTGSHILDSGGAYGRHWQRPPITKDSPAVTIDAYGRGTERGGDRDPDITATISLAHWLDRGFTLDTELMDRFKEWQADKDGTWFELGQKFCEEELHLHSHARDNVYNNENDFDQVFVWEVWSEKEKESDWFYADDALCVIYIHTGCDVRGGYGQPVFLRSNNSSYAMQIHWCAQFYATEGTDEDGNQLDDTELQTICEKWGCGYSPHPSSMLSDDVHSILESGPDWVRVKLKTGETVKVVADLPYLE